jgi:hypothetical protein
VGVIEALWPVPVRPARPRARRPAVSGDRALVDGGSDGDDASDTRHDGSGSGNGSSEDGGEDEEESDRCSSKSSTSNSSSSSGSSSDHGGGDTEGEVGGDNDHGGHGGQGGVGPLGPPTIALALAGGGRIEYYGRSHNFIAWCRNPDHGSADMPCRRVRTAEAGRVAAQGRPLGVLLAFIHDDSRDSREAHMDCERYAFAHRRALRNGLRVHPIFKQLESKERLQTPGEDIEPLNNA